MHQAVAIPGRLRPEIPLAARLSALAVAVGHAAAIRGEKSQGGGHVGCLTKKTTRGCAARAYGLSVLQLGRPAGSLILFLGLLVGIGAAFGHAIDMAGVAVFVFLASSTSAKPAWKFWFDPPAKRESGRASCAINSWQRVGATSPKEIRQLPEHRF